MDRGIWKKPVILEIYGRPGLITVSDTLEAALLLLRAWPAKRSEAHITAVMTCRNVLTGRAGAGLARADFIEAALEAGYQIQPETFLDDPTQSDPTIYDQLKPAFALAGTLASQVAAPARNASSRRPSGPSISWDTPPSHAVEPERVRMRDLMTRLAEVLGLIALEIGRNAAGMLNIGIRRSPNREIW